MTKKINKDSLENKDKKYIALKTIEVICNNKFQLIKDKEIPKGIDPKFIKSLINSNLIK